MFILFNVQGGVNVGYIIYNFEGKKFVFYLVFFGIFNEEIFCVIGNGVVVYFSGFFKEIDGFELNGVFCKGCILVLDRVYLLFDFY